MHVDSEVHENMGWKWLPTRSRPVGTCNCPVIALRVRDMDKYHMNANLWREIRSFSRMRAKHLNRKLWQSITRLQVSNAQCNASLWSSNTALSKFWGLVLMDLCSYFWSCRIFPWHTNLCYLWFNCSIRPWTTLPIGVTNPSCVCPKSHPFTMGMISELEDNLVMQSKGKDTDAMY